MHAHTVGPGQFEDLNGNKIIGNVIGKNNIDGDTLDSPASPEDLQTTGVLVFSGGTPLSVAAAAAISSSATPSVSGSASRLPRMACGPTGSTT